MRHPKSSWKDPDLDDFDRPLKNCGKKDAQAMAQILVEKELLPEKLFASSAKRTRRTAEIIVEETKTDFPVEYLDQLYLAETPCYENLLRELPDDLNHVMIIGHNPGIESLVQIFCKEIESIPAGAIALVSAPVNRWKDLMTDIRCDLVDIYKPKQEKEGLSGEMVGL
jgi:phosphohistidine phosphatase